MRFGILGTGRITRRLVADLQSTDCVKVTAIASRTANRARWHADQYGIEASVEGYEPLLRRDDVDAVYIALPPSLHHQWSIRAAEMGKHLLCEKPLALDSVQAESIDAAGHRHGVRWLDATAWLHHPRTDSFAEVIRGGDLGELGHISAAVSFYRPFQSSDHRLDAALGGGCLLDLGWYAVGLVRFAAGRLPQAVYADAIVHDGVAHRVNGMIWFDQQLTASVSCGYDTATRKWFEVAGSAASLICDDFTRPWTDRPHRYWLHEASGKVHKQEFNASQEQRMIGRLCSESELGGWQVQALDTQRILDAFSESIRSGTKVRLPPPARSQRRVAG